MKTNIQFNFKVHRIYIYIDILKILAITRIFLHIFFYYDVNFYYVYILKVIILLNLFAPRRARAIS